MKRYTSYRNSLPGDEQYNLPEPAITPEGTQPDENIQDSAWYQITDSILGFADKGVDIWNELKYGVDYNGSAMPPPGAMPPPQIGLFGMPKPWGGVLAVTFVGLVGIAIYKIAK